MKPTCLQCGRCCLSSRLALDGRAHLTGGECPFLMPDNSCACYESRHETKLKYTGVRCLTSQEAARERILPNDCPYVAGKAGYKCVVDYEEDEP